MHHTLLIAAVICSLSNAANAATDTNYRLNTSLVPSAYELTITPRFNTSDDKAFTFDGIVTIQFTTTASTNQIKLHSKDLNFTSSDIEVSNLNTSAAISLNTTNGLEFDTYYEFAYINLIEDLVPTVQYTVKFIYQGPIRKDFEGFYMSNYLENGVKKWLGSTHMEPTHARMVFPCFDEPGLKATFTIHIDRPSSYQKSLSNTKMRSSVHITGTDYVRETFYPKPKMPTYLVAFIVSEYEAVQYSINGTQEFGIYARPQAKNQSKYAFEFGKKVVDALGTYFGINYYSTNENLKLDHVAVPDFSAGAMENWGLVTYREALLLNDPENSDSYYKYQSARVIAHETAHMWFGNLVTCHWWSDAWLNEGFASYFQDYITAMIEPKQGTANQLVTSLVYLAYVADDFPNSSPISNHNVNSPTKIRANFEKNTYMKAGSVIRMIHHLIQNDAFQLGLQTYLKNNMFGSGYPKLLYDALETGVSTYNSMSAYPNTSVTNIMDSWITQAGHPLLTVNIDYSTGAITLTQKRFYAKPSHFSNETYKIPITYTTGVSPDFTDTVPVFIMEEKTNELSIPSITANHSWVLFNVQETGLYRVNYDEYLWQIIASALRGDGRTTIHHLNRAKIVNDLFALFHADEVSFSTLHNVLQFMSEETDYSVWYAALDGFNKLRNNYHGNSDVLPYIEAYILEIVSTGVDKFGYEESSSDTVEELKNRQQLLELACKLDHEGCVEHALAYFKALKENGTEVPASLHSVAYITALRYGTGDVFDFLWNRMTTTNVANEVDVLERALAFTADKEKLKSYLVSMTAENSAIKTQDLMVPLLSALRNYSNLDVVMDSVQNDYSLWTSIHTKMNIPLSLIASVLHTDSDFTKFQDFLASCTECTDAAKSVAKSSLVKAKVAKNRADSHQKAILATLKSNSNEAMPPGIKYHHFPYYALKTFYDRNVILSHFLSNLVVHFTEILSRLLISTLT